MSKDCWSKETNAFEVDEEEPTSESGEHRVECAGGRVNTSVRAKPRAAVTVLPKDSCRRPPAVLKIRGKATSYRPALGRFLPDLGARKVQVELKDGSFRCVNPRVADTHRALMAVSEMGHMGHDVVFPRSDRGIKAYAYHEDSDTKLEVERANVVFELLVQLVPYKQTDPKSESTSPYSSLPALEQIGNVMDNIAQTDEMQYVPRKLGQVDRVDRARWVEHCGASDDSLSWNLSHVTQGETIRVDDTHPPF